MAALPGAQLRRPSEPGDKSLQHAARLQCESHPPRRLLQHQHSENEQINKIKLKNVKASRPRSRPLCLPGVPAGEPSILHPLPPTTAPPSRPQRPAWADPAAIAALTDNLLQLIRVPADGPAHGLCRWGRGRGWGRGGRRGWGGRCCRDRRGRCRCCHRGRLLGKLDVHGRAARLRHDAAGGEREDAPAGGRPST